MNVRRRWCCYCGLRVAETRDHVPPRAVFLRPLPGNMVTVPACRHCNRRFGVLDEEIRVNLSIVMQVETPATSRFWQQHALPTIRRKRRMRNAIVASMRKVQVTTPGGLHLGDVTVSPWDREHHNAFFERVARGLYFHHFGEILGHSVGVMVRRGGIYDDGFRALAEGLNKYCAQGSIGGDQFIYRYGRADDAPTASVWFMAFHRSYLVAVLTEPAMRPERHPPGPSSPWPATARSDD